ncbi:BLUF domain-containing protein [Paracoccus liaowanqingii]|uniref:BLUF domain-containing protein n=1 Tax=Paracoccus liaowanqingii TaxID=2560053 RepID=A0A4Y5SU33_9RHOB|nr:BLUF domain-containing protein [Paracoccus liaowanqingii]QDA35766.1 BLUF domain-containing protein [Paracoccus liaowanqingii]QDA36869.1 BLUF domain-containing protein [Paracoccus liaowanqingii]TGN37743.1 BLUF domain-containing protein [Paracoccus liaowanqingii]
MSLAKLIYTSNHGGLDDGALDDILQRSRANNEHDGISGVLIASDEDFMQFLEGERSVIEECFMRIMKDDRHQCIRVWVAGETPARSFSKWSMHCIPVSQVEQDIVSRYFINGVFDPTQMTQVAIEELCAALSARL